MAPAYVGYAMLALSAASAVQSNIASNRAKEAAQAAAEAERQSIEEAKRRLTKDNAYKESLAKARAGASGVGMGDSIALYLADLTASGKKEVDWLGKVGASKVKAINLGAKVSSSNASAGNLANLGRGLGSAYDAYMNTPATASTYDYAADYNYAGI